MLETTLFYLLALGALIAAIGTVRSRSAVYSVLWLVASMCFIAGLYVLLRAFMLAAVQVLVYAGAILVLFLFVVMLMDTQQMNSVPGASRGIKVLAGLTGLGFVAILVTVVQQIELPQAIAIHGVPATIGQELFTRFVLPFELTSILILAAVTSIVVLAKKNPE